VARKCIFCGQKADSKEDAWPRWLTQRFIAPGTMETQAGFDAPVTIRQIKRPEIRIGWFCQKCNNGWMSQLEDRAIPVITRLLDQPKCTLDAHDRKTLALWAVKTAMVLEAIKGFDQCLYTDLERCLLSHGRDEIPPHTFVWIAKVVRSTGPYSVGRILGTGMPITLASVTTLEFGCLAIQVCKILPAIPLDPAMKITVEQREGPWEQALLQIWPQPPEPICWPPSVDLPGEEGMEALAKRFSPLPISDSGDR
jgi:hypothetical protein